MGGVPTTSCAVPRSRALLVLAILGIGGLAAARSDAAGLSGRVTLSEQPVSDVSVYAYQVLERSFRSVLTDREGLFSFASLPAGLYKIVAFKSGVPPAVLVLTRQAADESQYVLVELPDGEPAAESDFWALRSEVPADVLRDLRPTAVSMASLSPIPTVSPILLGAVQASAEMHELSAGRVAETAGANLDLQGEVGELRLRFEGEFRDIASAARDGKQIPGDDLAGRVAAFRLGLDATSSGQIGISGKNQEVASLDGEADAIDFTQYQVTYSKDLGEDRSTDLVASYFDAAIPSVEARVLPTSLPVATRMLSVQGSYSQLIGDTHRLRAGLRYRETARFGPWVPLDDASGRFLEVWSRGETDVNSTVLVQYGLFSTMRDGSVSFAPKGGLLVRLNPRWQASLAASRRFLADPVDPLAVDFSPMFLEASRDCAQGDVTCYQVQFTRGEGSDSMLRFGGSIRDFDRTVRLFLRDDFFSAEDGLFFVPGDRLPELQATLRHRLGDHVLASWTTAYAEGGGGVYQAADRAYYENGVAILSAAVDTRFEPTSTGIYLSFQQVRQNLDPVKLPGRILRPQASTRLETLELALSQDLTGLFDLASTWAVRLGMEVARGKTLLAPPDDDDSYRRRLTTSVAVRF